MSHLSNDQLSALLDRQLDARARDRAEAHLRECRSCQDTLAQLASQDQALLHALDHDPGDAYFESFADRVGDRLRADTLSGAEARHAGHVAEIFRSPRRLALVGAAAALVVGVGVVLMSVKETEFPQLPASSGVREAQRAPVAAQKRNAAESNASGAAESAPVEPQSTTPAAGNVERDVIPGPAPRASAPAPQLKKENVADERSKDIGGGNPGFAKAPYAGTAPPARAPIAAPNRLREVRRNEAGEDVVVPNELDKLRAQSAPAAPTPAAPGEPVRVRKQGRAEPMRQSETAQDQAFRPDEAKARTQQAAPSQEYAYTEGSAGRVCGDVRDPLGRPVAGAQVVLRETGTTAATDGQGHFCLDAPAGAKTLAVMAVGYRQAELAVKLGADEQYASVQLAPVSPTGPLGDLKGLVSGTRSDGGLGLATRGLRSDLGRLQISEPVSPAASAAMSSARKLSAISAQKNTAEAGQAAATEWERAASLLAAGAAQRDARFEAARERYGVWQRQHTNGNADDAKVAIQRFLAVEPAGPRRTAVEGWLKNL